MTNLSNELSVDEIKDIKALCHQMRIDVLRMVHSAKSGHPGGSLSSVEILSVLYKKAMKHCPTWKNDCDFEKRDRFILSKGHAAPAFYSVLCRTGYFHESELASFRKLGSKLQGHPSSRFLECVEVSTGSLGQGLSIACGVALGLKLDKNPAKVFALLGDGEIQEGSIWEAFMNASHHKLDNLIAFIDRNRLQIDGNTESVKGLDPLDKKIDAFGWKVIEIDGHNIEQIYKAICDAKNSDKPTAIIANTIKGKGVSYMENNAGWHGKAPNDEEFEKALKELEQS